MEALREMAKFLSAIKPCKQVLLFVVTMLAFQLTAAEEIDPKQIIKRDFWGNLYKDGGKTFYCKKSFKSKTPLITESYIYSSSWIRDYMRCGTNRQCLRENAEYREILSDLHNIVPANSYFEFKRRTAVFGTLDKTIKANKCGVRKKVHIIDPPDDIKGDIARVILYMHKTYDLPIQGSFPDLERWNSMDPPSQEEIARDQAIKALQGSGNPFVEDPSLIESIDY